eukprot:Hpha_TRINITY_DN10706_c0_g1::TRINITY_DN10706_c0_g1_i2::g.43696::m.43696
MPTPPLSCQTVPPQQPGRLQYRDVSLDFGAYLREIVGAVQQTQDSLAELRDQVASLQADLHSERGLRQHIVQTDAALTSVCEVLRVERRKREAVAVAALAPHSRRAFLGRYWRKLSVHVRQGERQAVRRERWDTLVRWHRFGAKRRRQREAADRLDRCTLFAHLRCRFREWAATAEARGQQRRSNAEELSILAQQACLRRRFELWVRHARWQRRRKHLTRSCRGTCEAVLLTLAERYWKKLFRHANRQRATYEVSVRACYHLQHACFTHWMRLRTLWRCHVRKGTAIRSLLARSSKSVGRRYFTRLLLWMEASREKRKVTGLSQRVESLGTQIDSGLQTLGAVTQSLNRLVDRFINVDQQLESLSRDKVGRRELSGLAGGPADRTSDCPSADRLGVEHPRSMPRARDAVACNLSLACLQEPADRACEAKLRDRPRVSASAPASAPTPTSMPTPASVPTSGTGEFSAPAVPAPDGVLAELARLDRRSAAARDFEPSPQVSRPSGYSEPRGGVDAMRMVLQSTADTPLRDSPAHSVASEVTEGRARSPLFAAPSGSGGGQDLQRQQEAQWANHFATILQRR